MSYILMSESASPGTPASTKASIYVDNAASPRIAMIDDGGIVSVVGPLPSNGSVAAVSAGYATDTYLAGSSIVVPAGKWKAATRYHCGFDMVKTNAGTAAFTVTVRMGTLGTTSDTTLALALAFAVGTAAVDTGWFDVDCVFRTVGSGTSAVVQGAIRCTHHLAATGLITTGASGCGVILATSSGFNSTTPTTIGCSVNGGTSFSGTNTLVRAELYGI